MSNQLVEKRNAKPAEEKAELMENHRRELEELIRADGPGAF